MPPPAPTFWKKVDENQVRYFIWPNALLCSIRHTISCPYSVYPTLKDRLILLFIFLSHPSLWNKLPQDVASSPSLSNFKHAVMAHL